jgi:hypothetical protein
MSFNREIHKLKDTSFTLYEPLSVKGPNNIQKNNVSYGFSKFSKENKRYSYT